MGIRGCIYNLVFLHKIIIAERLLNSARPIYIQEHLKQSDLSFVFRLQVCLLFYAVC